MKEVYNLEDREILKGFPIMVSHGISYAPYHDHARFSRLALSLVQESWPILIAERSIKRKKIKKISNYI